MPTTSKRLRRFVIPMACFIAFAVAWPTAALAQETPATAAAARPFTFDLSRSGDFVAQKNFVQCVGASMQMMLNMIEPTDDTSVATQSRLQAIARSLSGQRPDGVERKGASVRGWTAGLNELGAGMYRTVGATDLQATLKLAATAMRETNRPVGLLVWRGRHAWVMAGFTATADPLLTSDFEVTRVIVLDPLYPYGSKTWGPSPKPREALSISEVGQQFVPRAVRGGAPGDAIGTEPVGGDPGDPGTAAPGAPASWSEALAGKFVIVMPTMTIAVTRLVHAPR